MGTDRLRRSGSWLVALTLLAWLGCVGRGIGEEPESDGEMSLRRVFVPADDLRLLSPDYVPIDIDELDQLLNARKGPSATLLDPSTPQLIEATYVAGLVGQDLVSEASRWTIACQSNTPRLFAFKPCSLAVAPTAIMPQRLEESLRGDSIVDSQPFRFDLQGAPTVSLKQSTDFWFGWSLRGQPQANGSRLRFELHVPNCLRNRLVLQLPSMWRVESNDAIAYSISDPVLAVGGRWPASLEAAGDLTTWWLIEIGGAKGTSFELIPRKDSDSLNYDALILRERTSYRLQPSNLEVLSEFQFAESIDRLADLKLKVGEGLHIKAISVDDLALEWRPGLQPGEIEILRGGSTADRAPSQRRQLIVRGLAAWHHSIGRAEIPKIEIARTLVVDGQSSIAIHPDWSVNSVHVDGGEVVARSGTAQQGGFGRWDLTWTGSQPTVSLQASPRLPIGRAEALTRLANDQDGLTATTWVTLGTTSTPRSSLRMALAPGWSIESVQPSERKYSARVQQFPQAEHSDWEIHFAPAIESQAITLEIRLRNTVQAALDSANAATLHFDVDRPITFVDLRQVDFYWIEPTGRYKVDATTELLQCQVAAKMLSENHRQRLPQIGDVWLIKPDGGKIPRLSFRRQLAPYTAQIESKIVPSLQGVSVTYRLHCQPLAGPVSSVTLDGSLMSELPIRWRYRTKGTVAADSWQFVESHLVRREEKKSNKQGNQPNSVSRLLRVELPNAMSEPFDLEGDMELLSAAGDSTDAATMRIPLPSLPDAAQQDATLQIDDRFCVSPFDQAAQWTPLGAERIASGFGASRFRYDPIQVHSIDVQPSPATGFSDVWLSKLVTQFICFIDGQRQLAVSGRLHIREASALSIEIPSGWCLRKASVEAQETVEVYHTVVDNRVQLWMPRRLANEPSVRLEMILDGPSGIVQHREPLELFSIQPHCPVTDHRYEIWLPPTLSISEPSAILANEIAKVELNRLSPSKWNRALWGRHWQSQTSTDSSDSNTPRLAWSLDHVDGDALVRRSIRLVVEESQLAESWLVVFLGFALTACVGRIRKTWVVIIGLLLGFGIIAASERSVESIQLLAIGWTMAMILLILSAVCKSKPVAGEPSLTARRQTGRSTQTAPSLPEPSETGSHSKTHPHFSAAWIGWLVFLWWNIAVPTVLAESSPSEATYQIVVPIDEQNEVTSKVAYLPEELLRRLRQEQSRQDRMTQLVSARYQLLLDELGRSLEENQVLLNMKYEIDVRDVSQPIVWPLDAKQATFVSLSVDGSEIPLGSRLRWNDRVLQWTPPGRGLTQVELKVAVRIDGASEDFSRLECDILSVAGAQLEIHSGEAKDIRTNALGRTNNPALGRLQVELGPRNTLAVSWRKLDRDRRVNMPSVKIENELLLLKETMVARTRFEATENMSLPNPLDLECDPTWQPVGHVWGSATMIDSILTNGGRRRYRLKLDENAVEASESGSVIMHWIPTSSKATLIGLPEIELAGVRVEEQQIHVSRRQDSEWSIEGVHAWPVIPSPARLEWFARTQDSMVSYRRPPNTPAASLRRIVHHEEPQAALESQLRFLPNQVRCTSQLALNAKAERLSHMELLLSSTAQVEWVRANNVEIPFSLSPIDDSLVRLQAFLDPDAESLDSFVVELVQNHRQGDWMPLPFPVFEGVSIAEHRVRATRVANQSMEWEGFDFDSASSIDEQLSSKVAETLTNDRALEVFAWEAKFVGRDGENGLRRNAMPSSESLGSHDGPRYRVTASEISGTGFLVSQLTRSEERWSFQVRGSVDARSNPIDGVLLDVPTSMLESLEGNRRFVQLASPETGRQLIFVFSDHLAPEVSFDFELTSLLPPIEDNATTSIPEIRVLDGNELQQWLLVPRSIANQEARWSLSGARIVDATTVPDFVKSGLAAPLSSFLAIVPTTDRPSVRLSSVAANPLSILLDLTWHELASSVDDTLKMRSSFFFIPRGQISVRLKIPSGVRLLAIERNGRAVPDSSIVWSPASSENRLESERELIVHLVSASVPHRLTIHTTRDRADGSNFDAKSFPHIPRATGKRMIFTIRSPEDFLISGARELSSDQTRELIAKSVVELVEQSAEFVSEVPLRERIQWWEDWERATASIWRDAIQLPDQAWLLSLGDRRQTLLERLQLPNHIGSVVESPDDDPSSFAPTLAAHSLESSGRPNWARTFQFHAADRAKSASAKIQWKEPTPGKLTSSNLWFGWGLWLLASIGTIVFVSSRCERWIESAQQVFSERPWWLFVFLGVIAFGMWPNRIWGILLLMLAFYFAVRAYLRELTRISRASQSSSRASTQ